MKKEKNKTNRITEHKKTSSKKNSSQSSKIKYDVKTKVIGRICE